MFVKINFALLFLLAGFISQARSEPATFEIRKSMLDTAERIQQAEKDPYKRFQLLLRWIKIKEDYDQKQAIKDPAPEVAFKRTKDEIIGRIQQEIAKFESIIDVDPSVLHRELGYRYLEIKNFDLSQNHFMKVRNRGPDDEMALGDAMLGRKEMLAALANYSVAAKDPRLKPVATYKRAWAYLQMTLFKEALAEFDLLLSEKRTNMNDQAPADLRGMRPLTKLQEEAFRDRLRPYVERFAKEHYDEAEYIELKNLAAKVRGDQPKEQSRLVLDFLRGLLESFNSKAKVRLAEEVFAFIARDFSEAENVLLAAAPLWLKVYRGQLDHASVERILRTLPAKPLKKDLAGVDALQAELNNTALFYETLVNENEQSEAEFKKNGAHNSDYQRARRLLWLVYATYFQNFPNDPESDPLRINFAKLLLEEGDPIHCLSMLALRTHRKEDLEKVATTLEAKCELKEIDQLYAKVNVATAKTVTVSPDLSTKLAQALLEKKIYERPDLGVTSEQAYESLSRMVMGLLQKDVHNESLRKILNGMADQFAYPEKLAQLKYELQMVRAELKFEDLVASSIATEKKADAFYEIFALSPVTSNVARKSLTNSILIDDRKEALERCKKFQSVYGDQFSMSSDIFKRCLGLTELHLAVETQFGFLKFQEASLDEKERVHLGLIELALHREEGRTRLKRLNSEIAKRALASWDGPVPGRARPIPATFTKLANETDAFIKKLKPINVQQISAKVPQSVKDFEWLQHQWMKYYQGETDPLALAKSLEKRALMTVKMRDWMMALPEPKGLNDEELKEYRTKSVEVVKPWVAQADQALHDCSENAYAFTPDFKEVEGGICAENTKPALYYEQLEKWHQTRQITPHTWPWSSENQDENQKSLFRYLEGARAASETKDMSRTRYFLIRALDFANSAREKAHVHLQFARLRGGEDYWISAAQLDGNLKEPIQHFMEQAKGNPFYERLYQYELDLIQKNQPPSSISIAGRKS